LLTTQNWFMILFFDAIIFNGGNPSIIEIWVVWINLGLLFIVWLLDQIFRRWSLSPMSWNIVVTQSAKRLARLRCGSCTGKFEPESVEKWWFPDMGLPQYLDGL
jgi:hypothetical protein